MQKKLLLLGTSNGTIDIINYARSQGIYTIVTDYLDPEHSPGKKVADEYWMINTGDLDILEEKCRKENVNAVFCAVSGFNLRMCMALTKRLGLPFYMSQDIWNKTGDGDKSEFKKICKQCNAPIATDYVMGNDYTEADLEHIIYPVVVKPVDKGGNTGISFCDNEKELIEAIKKVREVSTNPHIIVERKIDGDEWFSTYALVDGEVRFLSLNAMYHEPGYPSYCYSLTTTATRYIKPFLDEINGKIEEVLKEMGCKDGFAWVQVMRDNKDGKFYIIEMGYRLDSDMLYLPIKYIRGYDVTKAMVDYACGLEGKADNPLPKVVSCAFKECGAGLRFWSKKKSVITSIEGLEEVKKMPGVYVEMRKNVGDEIDQYRYIGTVNFASKDCDSMCDVINKINQTLFIRDEAGDDIIIKFTDFDNVRKIYKEGLIGI